MSTADLATFELERFDGGWSVLVDGELVGHVLPLTRGHGWRAGLVGEHATGRFPTRLGAADAVAERHAALAGTS